MTIPALWLYIGIHVAVEAKKLVIVTTETGIKTLFKSAAISGNMDAMTCPNRRIAPFI
jgi:hypothetical protein